jgi:hypothetical protein
MKKKDNNLSLKKANDMCRIQRIQVHSTIKMKRKKDRCKVFSIAYRHCSRCFNKRQLKENQKACKEQNISTYFYTWINSFLSRLHGLTSKEI